MFIPCLYNRSGGKKFYTVIVSTKTDERAQYVHKFSVKYHRNGQLHWNTVSYQVTGDW